MKILIIEDYEPLVKWIKDALGSDTEVKSTDNLDEGIRLLREEEIDTLLLDLTVVGSTAMRTIQRIGEMREARPNLRIIVITGNLPPPPPDISKMVDDILLKGDTLKAENLMSAIRPRKC